MKRNEPRVPIPVKRCLRVNQSFVCGICRRHFISRFDALACLDSCEKRITSSDFVGKIELTGKVNHKCHICNRLYEDLSDALGCSAICRSRHRERAGRAKQMGCDAVINDTKKIAILQQQLGRDALVTACQGLLSHQHVKLLLGQNSAEHAKICEGKQKSQPPNVDAAKHTANKKRRLWVGPSGDD